MTDHPNDPQNLPTATQRERAPVQWGGKGLELQSLDDAIRFAQGVIQGGMAPAGIREPGAVVALIQAGQEIGLPPMFALSYLTFINGRLGIMGQAAMALVRDSGVCRSDGQPTPIWDGEGDDYGCTVRMWRKDRHEPIERTFTVGDAKRMKLWGKGGPWTTDPDQMLMWRASSRLFKTEAADVLMGMTLTEEVRDHERVRGTIERDVTPPKGPDPLIARLTGGEDAPATEPKQEEEPIPSTPPEVDSPGALKPEVLDPEIFDAEFCTHPDGFGATADRPERHCIHCNAAEPGPSDQSTTVDRGEAEGPGQEELL